MAWNTPLSPERKELLDRLVAENKTISSMKKEHGFGYATVRKHYPDYRVGAQSNQYTTPLNSEEKRLMDLLVAEGAPLTVISEIIGRPEQQIKRLAPNAGSSASDTGVYASAVRKLQEMGVEVK